MKRASDKSCLIVGDVTTDESVSMGLYRRNIMSTLRRLGWRPVLLQMQNVRAPRILSKIWEAALRYVWYPVRIIAGPETVVHVLDHTYAFLLPIARITGKKSIISVHNRPEDITGSAMWRRHKDRAFLPSVNRALLRWSLGKLPLADRIICISPSIERALQRSGIPKQKLAVIPPPISDIFLSPLRSQDKRFIQNALRKKGSELYILHAGNNDPAHKNVAHILRCIQYLRQKKLPARFVKAGEPFSADLVALIRTLGIGRAVTHIGPVSQQTLRCYYHISDALLFPSYYEGCPAPPWEALACGTPIILSDIPPHKDCFGGFALFTGTEDFKTSALHIAAIRQHPKRLKEKAREGKRAAKHMTPSAIVKRLNGLYASVS